MAYNHWIMVLSMHPRLQIERLPKTGKPDRFGARGQGQLHQWLCQSQGSGYDEEKHPFRLESD
jgi:hypothetical protein